MTALLRKLAVVSAFCPMLVLSVCVGLGARGYAQAQTQPDAPPKVAALHEPLPADTNATSSTAPAAARPPAKPDPELTLDIAKELAVMKARIEQLEAELKTRSASAQPASAEPGPAEPGPAQPLAATSVPVKSEPAPATTSVSPAVWLRCRRASRQSPQRRKRSHLSRTGTG